MHDSSKSQRRAKWPQSLQSVLYDIEPSIGVGKMRASRGSLAYMDGGSRRSIKTFGNACGRQVR